MPLCKLVMSRTAMRNQVYYLYREGVFHCQLQHCKNWVLGSLQIARGHSVDPSWCKA